MKRKSRKRAIPPPPPPAIDIAINHVQAAADRTYLPQIPYAQFVEGFGWCLDSTTYRAPEDAYIYPVSVLPASYCRTSISLW